MRHLLGALAAIMVVFGSSTGAGAQTPAAALGEAEARVACGGAKVVSAVYLESGALQVTCSQSTAAQTALAGTGLSTGPTLAGLAAVGVLIILTGSGGDDSVATTTTTAAPPVGVER